MSPPVPREWGAWAMVALPLVLGASAGGRLTAPAALVIPAAVLLFLARFAAIPGGTGMRAGGRTARSPGRRRIAWTVAYVAASALGLGVALFLAPPERRARAAAYAAAAGGLGVANAVLVLAGRGRRAGVEMLAMASVAAMAPLVAVLAGETARERALGAGLACLAYTISALVFVRTLRAGGPRGPGRAVTTACLAAHALLLAGLLGAARGGWLEDGLVLTFVPALLRTVWGLARPVRNLRVVGWREVAVAGAFLAIGSAALA